MDCLVYGATLRCYNIFCLYIIDRGRFEVGQRLWATDRFSKISSMPLIESFIYRLLIVAFVKEFPKLCKKIVAPLAPKHHATMPFFAKSGSFFTVFGAVNRITYPFSTPQASLRAPIKGG